MDKVRTMALFQELKYENIKITDHPYQPSYLEAEIFAVSLK
jgi:hypothetical protein